MRITDVLWDDDTREHLGRHGVDPEEAEEVCQGRPWVLRGRYGRYIVLGRTEDGRYLTVILASLGGGRFQIITARPMDGRERHRYLRR